VGFSEIQRDEAGPIPPSGADIGAMEHPAHARADQSGQGGCGEDPDDKKDDKKTPADMTGIGATVAVDRFITAATKDEKDAAAKKYRPRTRHTRGILREVSRAP
jgi:hypothetical protein